MLKKISKRNNPEEIRILEFFSQQEIAADTRNHCIPLIATLSPSGDDDCAIYVMPILRQYDDPPFNSVGEAVDFLRQILEVCWKVRSGVIN